jgi:hypothetical protein
MKSKSIIFIGIIVAIFICTTQLSGLTRSLSGGDKTTDQHIQNKHKNQSMILSLKKENL